MTRVVLMEDYLDQARLLPSVQQLAQAAELRIFTTKAESLAELERRLDGAEIIITIRDRVMFEAQLLERLEHVKLISVCGPRLQPHIDLEAATRAGILVSVPPKVDHAWSTHRATAEMTWALVLALNKDLCLNDRTVRAGGWQTRAGRGLAGKTLGLVGLGKIGSLVAKMAQAFDMRVLAWSPRLTEAAAAGAGVERVPFERIFDSDVVSLHANLTDSSRHLVGARELALMRRGAVLVNTARAGLVDEKALREALESGNLAGAGLDVYWEEPLPGEHWLRSLPNVILQPHIAGFSEEGYADLLTPAVANVLAYLEGRPKDVANPELLLQAPRR